MADVNPTISVTTPNVCASLHLGVCSQGTQRGTATLWALTSADTPDYTFHAWLLAGGPSLPGCCGDITLTGSQVASTDNMTWVCLGVKALRIKPFIKGRWGDVDWEVNCSLLSHGPL